jgi:hypothetical protein
MNRNVYILDKFETKDLIGKIIFATKDVLGTVFSQNFSSIEPILVDVSFDGWLDPIVFCTMNPRALSFCNIYL